MQNHILERNIVTNQYNHYSIDSSYNEDKWEENLEEFQNAQFHKVIFDKEFIFYLICSLCWNGETSEHYANQEKILKSKH